MYGIVPPELVRSALPSVFPLQDTFWPVIEDDYTTGSPIVMLPLKIAPQASVAVTV